MVTKEELDTLRKICTAIANHDDDSNSETRMYIMEMIAFRRQCLEDGFKNTEAYSCLTETERKAHQHHLGN